MLLAALIGLPHPLGIIVAADATTEQRESFKAVVKALDDAFKSRRAGRLDDASASVDQASLEFAALVKMSTPETYDKLLPTMKLIEREHAFLQLEGASVLPLRLPARPPGKAAMASPDVSQPKPQPTTATVKKSPLNNGDSFTAVIQPILVSRCGQCHVSGAKGGFQMTSYETLMRGPAAGVVVFPGDVIASRLIETIETGDMPRGGGKVAATELAALKRWVAAGAKFDGPDPQAAFASAAPGTVATQTDAMMPATPLVKRATGKETVSFAADIAPLLVANCTGCHIDSMQTRGGLNMNTFAQLFRGGDSGAVVTPSSGDTSLIIRKLRGMEGDRMPAGGRSALADDSIALIAKWIDEGATLDGASESQSLTVMSQLAWADRATAPEVTQRRGQLATEHLALANASKASVEAASTDHFSAVGTVSQATLKMVAESAEKIVTDARALVGGTQGESYFRGKATIVVLPKRYDYSEFAKMVEARGIPATWNSHWHFDGIDAYIAVVANDRDEPETISQRLFTPIAALAMATRGGDVPHWFAEGLGVTFAARAKGLLARDARRKLETEIYAATSAMDNGKMFLDGKLSPEQSDRIGAALVSTMTDRSRRRQFDALLRELETGLPFEAAFEKAFGVPLGDYVDGWLRLVRGG